MRAALLAAALFCALFYGTFSKCPRNLPHKVGQYCFRLEVTRMNFDDAKKNCQDLGGILSTLKEGDHLEWFEGAVAELVEPSVKDTTWWLGIKLEDDDARKKTKDRTWSFDYDDEEFVQKDYKLWDSKDGPENRDLGCTGLNGSSDFSVSAVQCRDTSLPFVCMMREGKDCKSDDLPYLTYGSHCMAVSNVDVKYDKALNTCHPNALAPMKDKQMQKWVSLAAINSFIGGAIFQNLVTNGFTWVDPNDGYMPPTEMWADGEPGDAYKCAGLALQDDGFLKLKTINCNFLASSFCVIDRTYHKE